MFAVKDSQQGIRRPDLIAPAVEVSLIAQKLKEIIAAGERVFGSTPSGSDWCVKALHPSDPMCEVRGVPDESAFPSVMMNYQSTFTLSPKANATGTWSFDTQLTPHPVNFMSFTRICNNGTDVGSFLNGQLGAVTDTHFSKYQSFNKLAKRWRLAYMAVTMYQDGPDLANQGTVVVCQHPVAMRKYCTSFPILSEGPSEDSKSKAKVSAGVGAMILPFSSLACYQPICFMDTSDYPVFEVSQNMPNAYFNKSKEGVYAPMKLSPSSQRWRSAADDIRYSTAGQVLQDDKFSPGTSDEMLRCGYPFSESFIDSVVVSDTGLGETSAYIESGDITGALLGERTADFLNDIWVDISARNLAVTTSVSFFVRAGIELQVVPSSELTPHQKLSPPLDRLALDSYFSIARELKDAYPADFNDLGKIWDAISSAAKTVAPFMNFIPEIGPLISMGLTGAAASGDLVKSIVVKKGASGLGKSGSGTSLQPTVSAATVERAREQRNAQAFSGASAAAADRAYAAVRGAKRKRKPKKKKSVALALKELSALQKVLSNN